MTPNVQLEGVHAETEHPIVSSTVRSFDEWTLRLNAADLAQNLRWLPKQSQSRVLAERCRTVSGALKPLLRALEAPFPEPVVSDDSRWLYDNVRLLVSELENARETFKGKRKVPHVRTQSGAIVPRVLALVEAFLAATAYQFSETAFTSYVEAFQQETVLKIKELWALVPVLKLVLLEQVAARGPRLVADPAGSYGVDVCMRSLRDVGQACWKDVLEPLICFDRILREDPANAYSQMDFDSRDLYRNQLAALAERSDFTEMEVAIEVLALARESRQRKETDPRVALRGSHVGYYLLEEEGRASLGQRVNFNPPFMQRISSFLRKHPDQFYLSTVELFTFTLMSVIVLLLVDVRVSFALTLFSLLALLLPCSQSAVQLTNYLITLLVKPQILPKLDLSEGVPDDCITLVAVPSLLLDEGQVHKLVDELEVRFLGNHDRNMHFALLSDLPDSCEQTQENDPLADLCSELIRGLNEKYAGQEMGSFFMFHRHRVYNPREKVWMGWERKRGKLMDLNRLLRQRIRQLSRKGWGFVDTTEGSFRNYA